MITEEQYKKIADKMGVSVADIKTVRDVESSGNGFLPDGSLKILFEGHKFWSQLVKKGLDPKTLLTEDNKDVLYKNWTKKFYKGGIKEYDRLKKALEISNDVRVQEAALEACSYGGFQIMGFHAKALGFKDVYDMIFYVSAGEYQSLDLFYRFCEHFNLTRHLRSGNIEAFVEGYNGSGQIDYYVGLWKKAYKKYA